MRGRARRWSRAAAIAIVCLMACTSGCADPVAHLVQQVRTPPPADSLLSYVGGDDPVDAVNRASRSDDAARLLIPLVKDDNRFVRSRAARVLGLLHADPKLVVPTLLEARADLRTRYDATVALGSLGPADDRVVPALILSLKDENPRVREAAIAAFSKIGPAGESAVPTLIAMLNDKTLGNEAAQVLGAMGPKAKPAAPALAAMAMTDEGYNRLHAAVALWHVDPDEVDAVVSALVASLNDPFLPIRRDAAQELGKVGPPARAAVPALIATRDYRPEPRPASATREPGTSALPFVGTMPDDEFYPRVRGAAVEALRKIEGGSAP